MSNPHANHQGEPGDTGTGGSGRVADATGLLPSGSNPSVSSLPACDPSRGPAPGDLNYRSEWEASREISHEEAREIARRLIASHFRRTDCETARVGIPARPDYDDDLLICSYIKQQSRKDASAPTPPDRVGEEVGRELEELSAAATQGDIVAEPYTDDHGGSYLMAGEIQIAAGLTVEDGAYLAALARNHRSGKLVASTGSGEETKGADPYLTETTEPLVARLEAELGVKGINSVFRRALAIAKEASAEAKRDHVASARLIPWEPGSLGGVDLTFESGLRVALPLSEPEATPKSSPDQTPVDPQTDRDAINFALTIDDHYDHLEFLQSWIKGDLSEWPEFAPSDAPSTTEADR